MVSLMKALQLAGKKTLLLVPKTDKIVWKSGRNIPRLNVLEAGKASTYEILDTQVVLIQKSAVEVLEKSFS
jgi:large subunit ribosomal protein L4